MRVHTASSIVQLALPSCMQAQDDDLPAGPGETALIGKGRIVAAAVRDKLVQLMTAYVSQDVYDGDWTQGDVAAAAAESRGLHAFQRARSETDGQLYSQAYTRCRKRWVCGGRARRHCSPTLQHSIALPVGGHHWASRAE